MWWLHGHVNQGRGSRDRMKYMREASGGRVQRMWWLIGLGHGGVSGILLIASNKNSQYRMALQKESLFFFYNKSTLKPLLPLV